jgi:fermentation-respiration switch protein FrsA (DUF1100 family)
MTGAGNSSAAQPHWSVRVLVYLLVAVVLWYAMAFLLQRTVLFPRMLANVPAQIQPPSGTEVWWLDTDAGPVEAWYLPRHGGGDAPGPAVVFAHGNGERIDFWPGALERYRELGVSVLLVEYRGYGRSAGTPSADAILDDFARFVRRLAARADVDASRIVYHGRSLGGVVLGTLAATEPPAALIFESSFTSTAAMARRYLIPRILVRDPFDALAAVQRYDAPVLVLHGERDSIIPPVHAERLHAAAADGTLVWFDADHNDRMPEQPYWHAIEQFLARAAITRAAPGTTEPPD